jgi:hypothetical protein
VPVVLDIVGDDSLSLKLRSELESGIRSDGHLQLAETEVQGAIFIQTDSNVVWDKLDGREVAIVIAYVFSKVGQRESPVVAACWTNNMTKCAREVISVAQTRALLQM